MMGVSGRSDQGKHGDENEDGFVAWRTAAGGQVLVVCDGMGGMGRGADASRAALEFLESELAEGGDGRRLEAALSSADLHLRRVLAEGPGAPGCTAVAVSVEGGRAHVAWAGDARAYWIRDGRVLARTRDHKLVEELIEAGHLTADDARKSPMAHVVTRALGGRREGQAPHQPEHLEPWDLVSGDAVVLCSDGVCDVLDDAHLASVVAGQSAEEAARLLVETAARLGSQDDITALVAIYGSAAANPGGATPTAPAAALRIGRVPPARTSEVDPLLLTPTAPQRPVTPAPKFEKVKRGSSKRKPESRAWVVISALLGLIVILLTLFLAWPARAAPGIEIVVLLDTSCSMARPYVDRGQRRPASDADRQAQLSALLIEGLTRATADRLTVVPFHGAALPGATVDQIQGLTAHDGTPYLEALRAGRAILDTSPRTDRILVFVSDGAPTDYDDPEDGFQVLGPTPAFDVVVLGLLPPDLQQESEREALERYLKALARSGTYVRLDDAEDLTREVTAAWAKALGSKAISGSLAPQESRPFRVGRYVSEVMVVTAGAAGAGPYLARVTGPGGVEPAKAEGDNRCPACPGPIAARSYQVWRFAHDPATAVDRTLTVDRARGPVSYGIILRYDLAARATLGPAVAGGSTRVEAHLDWRGEVFNDPQFFSEDNFVATARVGSAEIPMRVSADGTFTADIPVTSGPGAEVLVDVVFRNSWMEERVRARADVAAPPRLDLAADALDLGGWTAGGSATSRCGEIAIRGDIPAGIQLKGAWVGDPGPVEVSATPAEGAGFSRWRVCATAPRCCGAFTSPPDFSLNLAAEGIPGGVRVPVSWRVAPASFWLCWGPWIAALLVALLLLWLLLGLLRGHDFEPDARVRVASGERQLGRASATVLREQPRGRRGFYRNARICLTASGEFVASPQRAVIHLEATGKGHARFHLRGPLERQDRRTKQWIPVTADEAREGPTVGTLYRCGDLVLRFD